MGYNLNVIDIEDGKNKYWHKILEDVSYFALYRMSFQNVSAVGQV